MQSSCSCQVKQDNKTRHNKVENSKNWYPSGQLKTETIIFPDRDLKIHYEYYENGKLQVFATPDMIVEYDKDGKKISVDTRKEKITYYDNGIVKSFCRNYYEPIKNTLSSPNEVESVKRTKLLYTKCSYYDEKGALIESE